MPSVKKKVEPNRRPLLGRPSLDNDENDDEDDVKRDEEDDDDDERGARPTLGTMDALAFQQSILGDCKSVF